MEIKCPKFFQNVKEEMKQGQLWKLEKYEDNHFHRSHLSNSRISYLLPSEEEARAKIAILDIRMGITNFIKPHT